MLIVSVPVLRLLVLVRFDCAVFHIMSIGTPGISQSSRYPQEEYLSDILCIEFSYCGCMDALDHCCRGGDIHVQVCGAIVFEVLAA